MSIKYNEMVEVDVCRTCLLEAEPNSLRSIFKAGKILGQATCLKNLLVECLPLEFNENDGLPEKICNKCVMQISKSYIFRLQCLKSDKALREKLETVSLFTLNEIDTSDDDTVIDNEENQDKIVTLDDANQNVLGPFKKTTKSHSISELAESDRMIINENDSDNDNLSVPLNQQYNLRIDINSNDNDKSNNIEDEVDDDDKLIYESIYYIDDDEKDIEDIEYLQSIDELRIKEENEDEIEDDLDENYSRVDDNNYEFYDGHLKIEKITDDELYEPKRQRGGITANSTVQCQICMKVLSNYSSYKYHLQLHSDATPYLCSDCGQGFKTRNAYQGHLSTHRKDNPNTCQICNKSYRQAASLRTHILTHTGEKPFLCGICGKGMTQKSGFKKHLLTHTGEKPHQCHICQKYFRFSSNLTIHIRTHTGERPYPCEVCPKRFIGFEQLKRHRLIHTGEKPFQCDICHKCFNRKSTLVTHQNVHTNIIS